ncbi:hypothetical protein BDZ85DRAFT_309722 [Elsinoe ampelina]|uniref:Uncharacterized protein n=1 Tax=Elsinoe ampelina TaxID=302913 RepID=A0A6A6GI99_9PEZI|nr:hypothetical protein BDZ85DRAFT_309722 [Elsinoe ampelina]
MTPSTSPLALPQFCPALLNNSLSPVLPATIMAPRAQHPRTPVNLLNTTGNKVTNLNLLSFAQVPMTLGFAQQVQANLHGLSSAQRDTLDPQVKPLINQDLQHFSKPDPEFQLNQPIVLRNPGTVMNLSGSNTNYLVSLLVHGADGHTVHPAGQECTSCAQGNGKYNSCVTMRTPDGTVLLRGSCTNCGFQNNHHGCSLSNYQRASRRPSTDPTPVRPRASGPMRRLRGLLTDDEATRGFLIELPDDSDPSENQRALDNFLALLDDIKAQVTTLRDRGYLVEQDELLDLTESRLIFDEA